MVTDVTPVSFSVIWASSEPSTSSLNLFEDAGGTTVLDNVTVESSDFLYNGNSTTASRYAGIYAYRTDPTVFMYNITVHNSRLFGCENNYDLNGNAIRILNLNSTLDNTMTNRFSGDNQLTVAWEIYGRTTYSLLRTTPLTGTTVTFTNATGGVESTSVSGVDGRTTAS